MEKIELEFVKKYTQRIEAHDGDVSVLSSDEFDHLKILFRKYEIEQKCHAIADKLSQGTLL
jgi:hypothetical protein